MSTKIVVFSDIHANLPALSASLSAIHREGYDLLVHTGDAINIGPFPEECMDLLLKTPRLDCIMGNHDAWFAHGIPVPVPAGLGEGELRHQEWTHARLAPELRAAFQQWPIQRTYSIDGLTLVFLHYALVPGENCFQTIIPRPSAVDLDRMFININADIICYGHDHAFSDQQGRLRYINPGSLGCCDRPVARYSSLELDKGLFKVTHHAVPYEDNGLMKAFIERDVPDRQFITKVFFGGRFGT